MRFFRIRPRAIAAVVLPALISSTLLQAPPSNAADTPNFGYLGYTWISSGVAEFEVSPPIVNDSIKEYQLGASYSLSACDGMSQMCSYSNIEIFKSLSPSELTPFRNVTLNSSNGTSRTFLNVQKFKVTSAEMQRFLSSRSNARDRSMVFSIRALYGNSITEWSERNVATPTQIWGSSDTATEKNLTIGYQGPLTGPEAQVGIEQSTAVKYAIAKFNKEYSGRFKVSLVEIDDQGDPSIAANVAPGVAANTKILGLVGPAYSGATIATLPSYKNVGLAMISPSATREALTDPNSPSSTQGSPVFHRVTAIDRFQGAALYKLASAGVSSPKAFVVDDQSAYGVGLSNSLRNAMSNGQLVGADSIDSRNTDLSPTIQKIRVSGANIVIYAGYFPQAISLNRQLRSSGYAGVFASGDGSYSNELISNSYSSALEDMRITTGTVPLTLISSQLEADFVSTIGKSSGIYAAESIDATNVLLYCLATGVETRSAMLACIKTFRGESIYGNAFGFDTFGNNTTQRFSELIIKNRTFRSFTTQSVERSATSRWWPWMLSNQGSNSSTNTNTNTNNGGNTSQTNQPSITKPTTPSFSGVNFVGNKINVAVNIGSNAASRPDKVYLVAPKLGITAANPLPGSISGSNATWSIDFDKLLGGTMIPLEVISEKDGVKSDPANASYQAPAITASTTSVPPTPTNFKSRIVGSSAVVTAEVSIKAGALATNAYLVSKNLGFTSARPLEGEVAGSKIIAEIDIKPSMAGKKYPVSIYVTNSKGKSKSLEGVISIPKAPSVPKIPNVAPKPNAPATVICIRSSQTRTFAGTKCPPGWEQP